MNKLTTSLARAVDFDHLQRGGEGESKAFLFLKCDLAAGESIRTRKVCKSAPPVIFQNSPDDRNIGIPSSVVELEDLTHSFFLSANRKKARIVSCQISDQKALQLWRADVNFWPLTCSENKDCFHSTSFYRPSELFISEIEKALSKQIPSLNLTHKNLFDIIRKNNPNVEIIIHGGLVRDTIYNIVKNGTIEFVDVDIALTLKSDLEAGAEKYPGNSIQDIIKSVLTELAMQEYGQGVTQENIKQFIADHFVEKETGYVGIGDCRSGDFVDIFNANTFILKPDYTAIFTLNSICYRYCENDPFLFSKSKIAIMDAINLQLRLCKNWFDSVEAFIEKPSEILRYVYLRRKKGHKAPQDGGMTRYAILHAIAKLIQMSKSEDTESGEAGQGSQYHRHLKNIKFGKRIVDGVTNHGCIASEKDITRMADKFFSEKFNDCDDAFKALTIFEEDGFYCTPELVAFMEVIKALLDDVDKNELFKNQSEALMKKCRQYTHKNGGVNDIFLDHEIPFAVLFDLMSEILRGVSDDVRRKLKVDLNQMVVDTNDNVNLIALKNIIIKHTSESADEAIQYKMNYLVLCLAKLTDDPQSQATNYEAQTWV